MPTVLRCLALLTAVAVVGGCQSDDPIVAPDGDGLADCTLLLEPAASTLRGEPADFLLRLGEGWSEPVTARWSVSGPADAAITVVDSIGAERRARIMFSAAGAHRVLVAMDGDATCGSDTVAIDVVVGSSDQPCVTGLLGPSEAPRRQATGFRLGLGAEWSDSTVVTWSVDDGARVVDESRVGAFRTIDVVFDRPGDYTVRALVRDDASACTTTETVHSVLVPLGACDVRTVATRRIHVGSEATLRVIPDDDWAFAATGARVEPTWTVVDGPADGVEIVAVSDGPEESSRTLAFDRTGTYAIEVELDDADFGDGFACPTWNARFEVEVIGPPSAPIALGEIALDAPATGRVFVAASKRQRVAFGTYGAVLIATTHGTAAVDLVTGDVLADVRRLDATVAGEPPWASVVFGPGTTRNRLRLVEVADAVSEVFTWQGTTWSTTPDRPSTLSGVVDLFLPPATPWAEAIARRGPPPSLPCSEDWIALVSTDDGRVHEMRYEECADGSSRFHRLRFDVAATDDPTAPLIGAARLSEGDVIAVTGGASPRAYRSTGQDGGVVVEEVGAVGGDPRTVRSLGAVTVVVSHGDDRIDVIVGGEVVAGAPVATGPTGVDLRHRDGGGVLALTTGDASVTVTAIDAGGQVVSNVTRGLAARWSAPLAGSWLHDPDFTYVIAAEGRTALLVERAP